MKRHGFFGAVLVAAVFALVGSVAHAGLATLLGPALAARWVAVALGGAYVLYLLHGTDDRTGRIAIFAGWLLATAAAGLLLPTLAMTLVFQVVMISIIRSLYHHGSVLAALLDLGLSAFALCALVWAGLETGSVFLSAWSFFLVQALHVLVPADFKGARAKAAAQPGEADPFDRARQAAESAIRRIATENS